MEEKQTPPILETETEPVRPYWIPPGVDFDSFPEELKVATMGLINPAYRELVLKAEEGLGQSTGMTIVYLMWLEVLDQIQLGAELANTDFDIDARQKREALIARHMRIVGAKNKTSNLLIRIYEFRQKWGAMPPPADPFRGTSPR